MTSRAIWAFAAFGLAGLIWQGRKKRSETQQQGPLDPLACIDWEGLTARIRDRIGWPEERTDAALKEYQEFLRLTRAHPDKIFAPLSEDMDEVWHLHILDTRAYGADCLKIFGRMLHHLPASPANRAILARAGRNTALYKKKKDGRADGVIFPCASYACGGSACDSGGSDGGCDSGGSSCSSGASCCGGGGD